MLVMVKPLNDDTISITDMKDGDIGVITGWTTGGPLGLVVQKFGKDCLIVLGKPLGQSYSGIDKWGSPEVFRVRILPKKTLLEIN